MADIEGGMDEISWNVERVDESRSRGEGIVVSVCKFVEVGVERSAGVGDAGEIELGKPTLCVESREGVVDCWTGDCVGF